MTAKPIDPDTGLPIVLCPQDGLEKSFGKYFSTKPTGIPAVLHLTPIQRFNRKMKPYNRMLILSKNYVIITYHTNKEGKLSQLRHSDAQITHCLPVKDIKEILYFDQTQTLVLRLKAALNVATGNPSVAFGVLDTGGTGGHAKEKKAREELRDVIAKIIQHSGRALNPPVEIPIKEFKVGMNGSGFLVQELCKPKKWKCVPPPDVIPFASWERIQEEQRKLLEQEKKSQMHTQGTDAEPEPSSPAHKSFPASRVGLPRTPESNALHPSGLPFLPPEPGANNEGLISSQLAEPRCAEDLRKELTSLRSQSENLQQQQKLHMTTLGASQRIVSMVVNNKNADDAATADGSLSPASMREMDLGFGPSENMVSRGSLRMNGPTAYRASSPIRRSPSADPLKMAFAPAAFFSDSESDGPMPQPLPPTPNASLPPPSPPKESAVEQLAAQLQRVEGTLAEAMHEKDIHIEVLRAALQGVMQEGEVEGYYSDEEEEEEEDWGEEEEEEMALHDSFDESDDEAARNSAAEETVQRAADSHAQSIQTRRREVEELLRQLQDMEKQNKKGGPQDNDSHHIVSLRAQLKSVLRDLEIEALSYQDAFITGLPRTQHLGEQDEHPNLAGLAGGVDLREEILFSDSPERMGGGGGGGGGGAQGSLPPFDRTGIVPAFSAPPVERVTHRQEASKASLNMAGKGKVGGDSAYRQWV